MLSFSPENTKDINNLDNSPPIVPIKQCHSSLDHIKKQSVQAISISRKLAKEMISAIPPVNISTQITKYEPDIPLPEKKSEMNSELENNLTISSKFY